MKATAHTAGPWREFQNADDLTQHDIIAADGAHIARIEPINSTDPMGEQVANARLIAAAPETAAERDRLKQINAELLAAAVLVVDCLENGGEVSAPTYAELYAGDWEHPTVSGHG